MWSIQTYRAEMPSDEETVLHPSRTLPKVSSITRTGFPTIPTPNPARYERHADANPRCRKDNEHRADVQWEIVRPSVIRSAVVRAGHGCV